jgi:DNA-binding transcriptional ArsR family regulator
VRTIGLLGDHVSDQIPASHRDLAECPPVAALSTVTPDGYPQTSVVWCDFDDQCLRVNTMRGFAEERNMRRREVLDVLITGEKPVGAIVNELSMSQPQISKHLRVLSEVGLVTCRAEGCRRLYRPEPARLRPLQEWLAKYEQAWNDRMDRINDYLNRPSSPPNCMKLTESRS